MQSYVSVFKDESKLDINYVPPRLPHREQQLNLVNQFFRFALEAPGKMTQRVLVVGKIGTGKTVLTQHFGKTITREAQKRGINVHYVHINCRECKGSLFTILQRIIVKFSPNFPRRGYSAQELLQATMQILNEQKAYLILTLDELEALIHNEGSDALYNLTRVQEDYTLATQRLSLIGVVREAASLEALDASTRSTLQRNIIQLEGYSKPQLYDIINYRIPYAFHENTVPEQTLDLVAESAASEGGDARYAIELLWRAGKYADAEGVREVLPEHVRKASASVYPSVSKDTVLSLSLHEKLFLLAIARRFRLSGAAYLSMGEAENAYAVVCEEYGQEGRGHTQIWKYVRQLATLGIIKAGSSSVGQRGKTTLISLSRVPAAELEQEISKTLRV